MMSRMNKATDRRNNTIKLLKNTLWNRSDDNDMDWGEIDEIKKEIDRIITTPSISITTGEQLSLGCETDYFFVAIKSKDYVSKLNIKLEKFFSNYYSNAEHSEHLKECKKIVVVFVVNELETRAFTDILFTQLKNDYIKQIKNLLSIKSKIKIDHVFVLNQRELEKPIEINNVDRYSTLQEPRVYNKINFEAEDEKESQVGYVATVDLIELIEIYNLVGDSLFANNVRYGISEQLGVNEAIRNTLTTEGKKFWYRNNGITILVKSSEFKLNCPNKIVFREQDDFSVINGAQTITVAANYYYETLAEIEKRKSYGDDDDKLQLLSEVIDNIREARVLLRIICISDEDVSLSQKEGNEISVALNRQKPIKVEDIAYTLEYIVEFTRLLEQLENDNNKFLLKKRGEQESTRGVMDLVEFSRARLACVGEPIKARNESASVFLKTRQNNDGILEFERKDVFKECATIDDFKKYYNGVKFAHDMSSSYGAAKKTVLKKRTKSMTDEDRKYNAIVNNAKWIFISHIMEALNESTEDYSAFDYSVDDLDISQMMKSYYDQAFKLTEEKTIPIGTFKSMEWANKIKGKINMEEVIEAGFKA